MNKESSFSGRGLAPYLTAGDGGLERTLGLMKACEAAGAVAIELGVPFSDPMADGPILQAAAQRALEGGTNLAGILDLVRKFRRDSSLPVALFSYANPLHRFGTEDLGSALVDAGVQGVLVPDLPYEEADRFQSILAPHGVQLVLFAAPTTSKERLHKIAASTAGFLYVIGRTGVTGRGTDLDPDLDSFLDRVLAVATTPVAVGFGLKTAEQVGYVLSRAQMAIVGSALVDRVHRAEDPVQVCYDYLTELLKTTD
jgi:tryptophan synthase alpha chain